MFDNNINNLFLFVGQCCFVEYAMMFEKQGAIRTLSIAKQCVKNREIMKIPEHECALVVQFHAYIKFTR